MQFIPEFKPASGEKASALWFIFNKGKLLTKITNDTITVPETSDLSENNITPDRFQYLGSLDSRPCYAAELADRQLAADNLKFKELRALFGSMEADLIWIAGRANQLVDWSRTHQYCGGCGHFTEDKTDERAKICPQCGLV
ncbi:MAG: NUDIX-like domain-containing protein, partial [Desulfobacterales bacterium]